MNPKLRSLLQLLAVALIAALSAWATHRFLSGGPPSPGVVGRHYSIHEELRLTAAQVKELAPLEASYEARWKELNGKIEQAHRELAESLRRDEAYSPAVGRAVEAITRAQADLQKVTLEHVFAMKAHLTSEQYQSLLARCASSLEQQ